MELLRKIIITSILILFSLSAWSQVHWNEFKDVDTSGRYMFLSDINGQWDTIQGLVVQDYYISNDTLYLVTSDSTFALVVPVAEDIHVDTVVFGSLPFTPSANAGFTVIMSDGTEFPINFEGALDFLFKDVQLGAYTRNDMTFTKTSYDFVLNTYLTEDVAYPIRPKIYVSETEPLDTITDYPDYALFPGYLWKKPSTGEVWQLNQDMDWILISDLIPEMGTVIDSFNIANDTAYIYLADTTLKAEITHPVNLDNDPANELQTLTIDSTGRNFTIGITDGNEIKFEDTVDDADADPTNEYILEDNIIENGYGKLDTNYNFSSFIKTGKVYSSLFNVNTLDFNDYTFNDEFVHVYATMLSIYLTPNKKYIHAVNYSNTLIQYIVNNNDYTDLTLDTVMTTILQDVQDRSIYIHDGKYYSVGSGSGKIYEYTIDLDYDIRSLSYTGNSLDISTGTEYSMEIVGDRLLVTGTTKLSNYTFDGDITNSTLVDEYIWPDEAYTVRQVGNYLYHQQQEDDRYVKFSWDGDQLSSLVAIDTIILTNVNNQPSFFVDNGILITTDYLDRRIRKYTLPPDTFYTDNYTVLDSNNYYKLSADIYSTTDNNIGFGLVDTLGAIVFEVVNDYEHNGWSRFDSIYKPSEVIAVRPFFIIGHKDSVMNIRLFLNADLEEIESRLDSSIIVIDAHKAIDLDIDPTNELDSKWTDYTTYISNNNGYDFEIEDDGDVNIYGRVLIDDDPPNLTRPNLHITGDGSGTTEIVQVWIENTNSAGAATFRAYNSVGDFGAMQVTGPTYPVPNTFGFNTSDGLDIIFNPSGDVASGGTSDVIFRVGGYTASQDRMTITPDDGIYIHDYGLGTETGTLSMVLGVNVYGKIIEATSASLGTDDQTLSIVSAALGTISIESGNTIDLTSLVQLNEADGSATNELQSWAIVDTDAGTISLTSNSNLDLTELVFDQVKAFFTGNTETGITVTPQDADNTVDFVVSGITDYYISDAFMSGDNLLFDMPAPLSNFSVDLSQFYDNTDSQQQSVSFSTYYRLGNTGQSGSGISIIPGSGISITGTVGTAGNITISATGGADGDGIYDGSGTVPSATVAALTNTLTFGGDVLYLNEITDWVGVNVLTQEVSAALNVGGTAYISGDLYVGQNWDILNDETSVASDNNINGNTGIQGWLQVDNDLLVAHALFINSDYAAVPSGEIYFGPTDRGDANSSGTTNDRSIILSEDGTSRWQEQGFAYGALNTTSAITGTAQRVGFTGGAGRGVLLYSTITDDITYDSDGGTGRVRVVILGQLEKSVASATGSVIIRIKDEGGSTLREETFDYGTGSNTFSIAMQDVIILTDEEDFYIEVVQGTAISSGTVNFDGDLYAEFLYWY